MKIKIVEYKSEYKKQIKQVIHKTLQNLELKKKSNRPSRFDRDLDLNRITTLYHGRGRFWVALKNNKVVGTAAIKDMGKRVAKLRRMFVLSEYHGLGVGKVLLDHALNFARKKGYKEIILTTHHNMRRAHHFYEKSGFKKIHEGKKTYRYKLILS